MKRGILILAIVLIASGIVGLVALNTWQSASHYSTALPYGMMSGMTLAPRASSGVNNGMMSGMMANGGMMSPGFGRRGYGMRGRGGMLYGGMKGRGGFGGFGAAPNIAPVTADQAVTRAQTYIAQLNNPDLAVAEVMAFSNNYYLRVKEKSTGVNAFEILVSQNGSISPEPGPNMMWNAKYSPMANMMGSRFASNAQNTVTAAQAKDKAQQYLDTYLQGAKIADDVDAFYGYSTIDILRDGKTIGMLGVNGTTGAVWYHTWHGSFVSEKNIQ